MRQHILLACQRLAAVVNPSWSLLDFHLLNQVRRTLPNAVVFHGVYKRETNTPFEIRITVASRQKLCLFHKVHQNPSRQGGIREDANHPSGEDLLNV